VEFLADWTGGTGSDRPLNDFGWIGCEVVWSVRLLAYQPEFFSGTMRGDAGDFESGIRVVPPGIRAIGIQSCGAVGTDLIAGVLGAHRICVWKIVDFAEREVRVGGGDGRTSGYFRRHARIVSGAHAVECASGTGRVAREARKVNSKANACQS